MPSFCNIGVSTFIGCTVLTRMLYSASSPAMDWARPMQPLFAAEYAEVLGYPLRPATELVMTIEPPLAWSIMAGMQAGTQHSQTPLRLMPMTSSQVCSGVSHDFLRATAPALATQMSNRARSA